MNRRGEKIISWVLAVVGVLQIFAQIPSIPFIYFAAKGLVSLLNGNFDYWNIRDSVVTVLTASLFTVSLGYCMTWIGWLEGRGWRLGLWGFSALLYLFFPLAQMLDPRPVILPAVLVPALLGYFLLMSFLSGWAFYFALGSGGNFESLEKVGRDNSPTRSDG